MLGMVRGHPVHVLSTDFNSLWMPPHQCRPCANGGTPPSFPAPILYSCVGVCRVWVALTSPPPLLPHLIPCHSPQPSWRWAARQGNAAKVRRLLEAGATPSLRVPDTTFGSYPLHAAAHAQAPAAIAVLMEWHMPRALPQACSLPTPCAFPIPTDLIPVQWWMPPQTLPCMEMHCHARWPD